MPRKTNTELILELRDESVNLDSRLTQLKEQLEWFAKEWSIKLDGVAEIDKRLAVLESKVEELKKSQDKSDHQRWMVLMALLGSLLTLAANLVVSFFRH